MKPAAFPVLRLGAAGPAQEGWAGPKASRLNDLSAAGFAVPKGVVIAYAAVESWAKAASLSLDDDAAQVAAKLAAHPGFAQDCQGWLEQAGPAKVLILRTAAETEDLAQQSMAGLFASCAGIRGLPSLQQAYAHCWAKAQEACRTMRLDSRLSFILQEYVEADFAGVAFTVSPIHPVEHEIVIELVKGGAEALTSGHAMDARMVYDWKAEALRIEHSRLEAMPESTILHQLGQACLKAQQYFGCPQDIEWAIADGQVYILQSRPITKLYFQSRYIWTNANFRDGGIGAHLPSPLMWSLYSLTFERSLTKFATQYHLKPRVMPESWSTSFLGYPYWNLSATKEGASKVLGYVERQFDEGQGVLPYYAGEGYRAVFTPARLFTSLRALLAIRRSIRQRFTACEQARAYFFDRVLPQFDQFPLESASLEALGAFFDEMTHQHLLYLYSSYWDVIYDNTFVSTFAQNALKSYNRRKRQRFSFTELTAGLDDIAHIRPMLALWRLAEAIRQDGQAAAFWSDTDTAEICRLLASGQSFPFRAAFQSFLGQYGYKSADELEIKAPNWAEAPQMPAEALQAYLRHPAICLPDLLAAQKDAFQRLFARIQSPALRKQIETQRRLIWWKEELRDITTHFYHLLRKLTLQLSARLYAAGYLASPDDAFYLDYQSLARLARGEAVAECQAMVKYHRALHSSFRDYPKPDIIFPDRTGLESASGQQELHLRGIGVCPGLAVGKAVVIPELSGPRPPELAEGSILVTAYINPSHIPFFNGLKAIVTANGGLLSHAAIMCREFGIPAVFGVPGLLAEVENGQLLEVDGQLGLVKQL
jgi:phosphohistidine swiveling domain-containing protein